MHLSFRVLESLFQVYVSLLELPNMVAHARLETIKVSWPLTRRGESRRFTHDRLLNSLLPECVFVVFISLRNCPRFALVMVLHLLGVD